MDAYDQYCGEIRRQVEEAPEERLVVVYGVTQSGKTALILQLVGVAEEHMKRVYRMIRGRAKQGRSSTSHAFLYRQSEDDCFRAWIQAGVAAERKNPAQLEREEDMSRYVDGLRESMARRENGNCFPLFIQSLNSRVKAHRHPAARAAWDAHRSQTVPTAHGEENRHGP